MATNILRKGEQNGSLQWWEPVPKETISRPKKADKHKYTNNTKKERQLT